MKTIKIFFLATIAASITFVTSAQKVKTEKFSVNGNCGMCEAKIEKAAKAAGASFAEWDQDAKVITVKYKSSGSNLAKIQKSIANVGYDNAGYKSTDEAYQKLHSCCKYDREASAHVNDMVMDCCKDGKCSKDGHDGKDCCKKDGTVKMPARTTGSDGDCCKDGKCTMEGHSGMDCCKKEGATAKDCCKEGKCSKEGHSGKDCCKKS